MLFQCPSCQARIPGAFKGVVGIAPPPNPFCGKCGSAYPWASREDRIGQLRDLVNDEGLDPDVRLTVLAALEDLTLPDETANRKRIEKAGATVKETAPKAWTAAAPLLTELLSSMVRKSLGLP